MFDSKSFTKLPRSFYERSNVVEIAQDLVGKYLFTNLNGVLTVGKIIETEAYNGRNDRASHAYGRKTKRTEVMYGEGGHAYIYLCYGIHHLFNVVTNKNGLADAVLIRAIEPIHGMDDMMRRRNKTTDRNLTSGPGILSQALGICREMSGVDLTGDKLWIMKKGDVDINVEIDRRVGVDYAKEDAFLPWRFWLKGSMWVSKGKQPVRTK